MFVATLIAAGKLTDEVVREALDRLDATGHDVGAPHDTIAPCLIHRPFSLGRPR